MMNPEAERRPRSRKSPNGRVPHEAAPVIAPGDCRICGATLLTNEAELGFCRGPCRAGKFHPKEVKRA